LVVQITTVLLPVIAFFPQIRAALSKQDNLRSARMSVATLVGLHLAVSICALFLLHQSYKRLNGRLAGREPAYLHASGLTMLAAWAPALKPSDSSDPRLSQLIANGDQFHLKDIEARNAQLYFPGGLLDSWKKIEPNEITQNDVAKQAALHALLHRPIPVLKLGVQTFQDYWDFGGMRKTTKIDLQTIFPWDTNLREAAARFHVVPPRREHATMYRLLQRYQILAQPYYYIVLLSPLVCSCLVFLLRDGNSFLLLLHSWILLGTITLMAMGPTARYLQPMSLLTILIFALLVKTVTARQSHLAPAVAV
jgi:hypothetical protein